MDGQTVQQVGFYKERTSVLDVYGEISNQSDRALSNLGVFVELYNDAGERLARGAAPAISVNILKPGEKTVWFVFMSDHPASWARMEVKVGTFGGSLQESIDLDYPDLTLTDVSAMPAPNITGAIEVKGTVTNTGTGIGRAPEFAAAFYDDGGKLLSVSALGDLEPVPDTANMQPGESHTFVVVFLQSDPPPPTNTARIDTYVKAGRPNPTP